MKNHLQQLQIVLHETMEGMTEEQFRRHPDGKWCAAEILEHLLRTYRGTVKGLEKSLSEGMPAIASVPWKAQLARAVVIYGGVMPGRRKSPERVLPQGMAPERLRAELGPTLQRMEALLLEAEAKFGRKAKFLVHPVLGPLSGPQWRKFHWVHGRHHIRQIGERRRLTR
ncbi:MAG: DinB family protein [Acidobacteria bacterium]|nr:DinB family protein [Acidobacteriota bacterium]